MNLMSDLRSDAVVAVPYVILWYIGPRYNGTRLYDITELFAQCVTFHRPIRIKYYYGFIFIPNRIGTWTYSVENWRNLWRHNNDHSFLLLPVSTWYKRNFTKPSQVNSNFWPWDKFVTSSLLKRIPGFIHVQQRNTTFGCRPRVVLRCCRWINSHIRVSK